MIQSIPTAFIWRRLHSLMGLGLVIFLCEHLLINSQAALWIGDDGQGFIRMVNVLQAIPALQVVESLLIGIPILVHTILGIQRIYSSKINSLSSDGSTPSLSYARNHFYTWQRLSSWVLLVGITVHVVQMRFVHYPKKAMLHTQEMALVKVSSDPGLYTLAERLHVTLLSSEQITALKKEMDPEKKEWVGQLASYRMKANELVASAPSRGAAILLTVRDTFKSPIMDVFYTLFVLAAVFHAVNGFWTFLLTWGLILSMTSQKILQKIGWVGMTILGLTGLAAIWLTYFINLRS